MSSSRGGTSPSKGGDKVDKPDLFKTVRFYINDSIPPTVKSDLADLIVSKGGTGVVNTSEGTRFDLTRITHLITDTLDFPEHAEVEKWNKGKDNIPIEIVSPLWVTKSQDLHMLQPTRFYSADRALYFSGLCFCTSDLPEMDQAAIQAGVQSLGGQWRYELTREVTHLFVVAPDGPKYEAAMKFGPTLGMVALLPHWFEECLKLRQPVPIETYQFPDPPLLSISKWDESSSFEQRIADYFKQRSVEQPKRPTIASTTSSILGVLPGGNIILAGRTQVAETYQKTATVHLEKPSSADLANGGTTNGNGNGTAAAAAAAKGVFPTPIDLANCTAQIFADRIVYLASDLALRPGLEEALKQRVEEAGGVCWSWGVDGARSSKVDQEDPWERRKKAEKALKRSNTVVTRSREGWEFWQAFEQHKTIGNLPWMYHVLATSKLDSPLDHLLHYPLPPGVVPGFKDLTITISNYSGPARDYVRTMIESLGGTFEGAMSKKTGYVVTASEFGQKVKHAKQWGVPIVSHCWLENCISEWAYINPSSAAAFAPRAAPNTNFMTLLGHTELKKDAIKKWSLLPKSVEAREQALMPPEMHDNHPVDEPEPEHEHEDEVVQMEVDAAAAAFKDEDEVAPMDVDPEREQDQEDASPIPAPKPNGKGKSKEVPPKKTKPVVPKVKQEVIEIDDDEDEDDSTPAPAAPLPKPRRKQATSPAARKQKSAPAARDETGSDSDRGKPVVVVPRTAPKASTSAAPASVKPNGKARAVSSALTALSTHSSSGSSDDDEKAEHTPSQRIDFQNKVPVTGKRSAATQAAKRLAEQMPDANRFAKEIKTSGKKRRRSSQVRQKSANASDDESSEDSDDARDAARQKSAKIASTSTAKPDSKPKKAPAKKSALKTAVGRSAAATTVTQDGAISSFDNPPHAAPPKALPKARTGPKKVRILLTGLGIASDSPEMINWTAKLTRLGAKFTEEPKEATHLVVKGISRTEKFLCTLAFAPFIVTRKWIDDSVAANVLLDEEDYLLHDAAKERELGETLEAIVGRARAKKLFSDHSFYLTPNLLPSVASIRRVIECGGGFVSMATIDRLPVTDNVHVVSSPKDRSKWEKYASKNRGPVYSVEAVFQSVVHQELRFSQDYRIDAQV
ncbi:hypothetical protein RQP46_001437 [Phenoliferia psychrophenolica]